MYNKSEQQSAFTLFIVLPCHFCQHTLRFRSSPHSKWHRIGSVNHKISPKWVKKNCGVWRKVYLTYSSQILTRIYIHYNLKISIEKLIFCLIFLNKPQNFTHGFGLATFFHILKPVVLFWTKYHKVGPETPQEPSQQGF